MNTNLEDIEKALGKPFEENPHQEIQIVYQKNHTGTINFTIDETYLIELKKLIESTDLDDEEDNSTILKEDQTVSKSECKFGDKCIFKLKCYKIHDENIIKKWIEEKENNSVDKDCSFDKNCKYKLNCKFKHNVEIINYWELKKSK